MTRVAERMVVALGGNALLRKGDRGSAAEQEARSLAAMEAIAPLLTPERQVVITHGNGPIVGNLLIRQQVARHAVPPMPLDVCGAESQGHIGYLLERALLQILRQRGIDRPVATLLSLVEVDPHDPAFAHPTKPVGPFLSASEAEELRRSALERFVGRRKAVELAVQARAVREELRQIKVTFLPVLEQVVEKIFALNKAAATFNRTVSVAHLPQTQFLQCRVDLTQLLAALAELDVVVTPEMETLAASAQGIEAMAENGAYEPTTP